MKICADCAMIDKVVISAPEGLQTVAICKHLECRSPTMGDPLPLHVARMQDSFCGIKARHFTEKPAKENQEAKIVQLK